MGGHEIRNNIPCYMKDISCGRTCDKQLPDCAHKCIRTCHKGSCMPTADDEQSATTTTTNTNVDSSSSSSSSSAKCTQPCRKERPHCMHVCNAACHGQTPCPDTVCQANVVVKCKCGHKTKTVKCMQRMYESSQVVFENLASELKEMLSCKSIDISTFNSTQVLKKKHELVCDDECLVAERNAQFAQALQLDPNAPVPPSALQLSSAAAAAAAAAQLYAPPGGISVGGGFVVLGKATKPLYSDYLKEYARDEAQFALELERKLEAIVKETKMSASLKPSGKRMFTLPVMKSHERKFIHELASYYGLETQSRDTEPHRSVCVYACKDKCFIPAISLSQSVDAKAKHAYMPRLANLNKLNVKSTAATANASDNMAATSGGLLHTSSKFAVLNEEAAMHTLAHRTHSDDEELMMMNAFAASSTVAAAAVENDANQATDSTTASTSTATASAASAKKPIDYFDFS